MSQQEQNSGRGNPFGWIGAFMKGLKDYNVFELMKVLFAAACVTFMVLLITKPEIIFEQVDKVIESVSQAREDRHADGAAFRLRADENIRGEPTWQEQGDLASVEAEFTTATVVKKTGRGYVDIIGANGDFNDDYNNDFNNN